MNTLVCIKRVPGASTSVTLTDDAMGVDTKHVGYTTSPHEEVAVEAAVQRAEQHGGEATVLTVGPEDALEQLRDALAMGAKSAVHVEADSDAFGPADVARARTVLDHLAARVTHLGDAGSGQVVKLVNQVLVGAAFSAMAEAAALVRAEGLDPAAVLGALTGGRADSVLLQEFFVKFATGDLTPTGRIANMVKDLDTARDHGRGVGVPLPLTALVCELNRWLVANGHGDADSAALMGFFDADLLPSGGTQ